MLLSILSEADKKIVVLHTVYGFKHREIAELMSLPLGT
jgi:DNA-directed RNA polymerase specialized sigma24 family protein